MTKEDASNQKPKPRIGKIILGTILILIILGTIGSMLDSDSSSTSATSPDAPVAGQAKLEVLSYRCYAEYGYFHITGQVKNISDKSLENVTVVGSTYTEGGEFINSSDAIIDYNPILAGQTSPFTAMMTLNPAMSKCDISFKELMGGTIKTKMPAPKSE